MREPLATFLVATLLASALYWTGRVVPLVGENLHGAIALLFLLAPRVAAWLSGRPFDYRESGLRLEPVGTGLLVLVAAIAVAWPIFLAAFLTFYGLLCSLIDSPTLGVWADWMAGICGRWLGWEGARLRVDRDLLLLAFTQLMVVALPEELFFRGYLWSRLQERWKDQAPERRRFLGAPLGPTLWVTSLLFALGHVLVDLNPQRLAVFFPALVFGWMRARSGSIAPGALFHALCNLYSDVLHRSFFSR